VALARANAARVGAGVFVATLGGLYGVSAAYHRGRWSAGARRLMKHLDQSMNFVLIAAPTRWSPWWHYDQPGASRSSCSP
jgi:hemolysin III